MTKVVSTVDFKRVGSTTVRAFTAGVEDMADAVAEQARAQAPVESGRLRDSIQAQGRDVVAAVDYAVYVERKQPFLEPALYGTGIEDVVGAVAEVLK